MAFVDKFIDLLKQRNISWENKDGVKQIWLQDPDGYWVEINDAKD